ncbi:right-handed parallel beta-helix repeat-containing protein [Pseudonocardia alaniniphila]|uniref:Right-handed parallel beta-helix repeat-containing protein n=1 Tax=Pseudonocardia alaniniphila TaxID=75291 RepID=A0ABS9TDJ4_9PSEU|nr:right-handed parallel beta-helix repeat-containing protein [Pseudonocardia alaniniphila]MCH6166371.1 right-handed parallel beta-helix repeat-containing protein [Pseudonocardia alaniniphila]
MRAIALALGAAILASALMATPGGHASVAMQTVYVSTTATDNAAGRNCSSAAYDSIGKGVAAVAAGGRVVVCDGIYHEGVSVQKALTIIGRGNATIDATNMINGITVTASDVTLTGLIVRNAVGEGILVRNADRAEIADNVVAGNDTGLRLTDPVPNDYPPCHLPVGPDCGASIHLLGSSHAVVRGNIITDGTGGVLLSDETGPTAHNRIVGNIVADNTTSCGVTLAGHNERGAPGGVPDPRVGGVFDNIVEHNAIFRNGLQGKTGGAGVQMATPVPGGAVYRNIVSQNIIDNNGHPGVTLHSHETGQYMNGNSVTRNRIGSNNVNGDVDFTAKDPSRTGIFIGTVDSMYIEVTDNAVNRDQYGIFTSGPVTVDGEHENSFSNVVVAVSRN